MKAEMRLAIVCCTGIGLSSCAQTSKKGSVAMKVSGDEVHVKLGDKEVKAGDSVTLYEKQCREPNGLDSGVGMEPTCKKKITGGGKVIQTLSDEFSVVKVSPGSTLSKRTFAEKSQIR